MRNDGGMGKDIVGRMGGGSGLPGFVSGAGVPSATSGHFFLADNFRHNEGNVLAVEY